MPRAEKKNENAVPARAQSAIAALGFRIRSSLLEEILQRVIEFMQEPDNMTRVDTYIVSPLLNHMFRKVFPYLVLTGAMFLLVFAMLGAILVLLMSHSRARPQIPSNTITIMDALTG